MKTLRFVSLVLVLTLIASLAGISAVAESDDIYMLNEAGYPDRHRVRMTTDQVDAYEEAGWVWNVGVLWYKENQYVGEPPEVALDAVQSDLYNAGWRLVVLYNWLHDGPSLGKNTEQSVSVGYWVLDAVEAAEYLATYQVPELILEAEENPAKRYYSSWYFDNQSAMDPTGEESELVLSFYRFVRQEYDLFSRGYGEEVVLKNGNVLEYSFDEASQLGGVEDELVPLN